jgi:lambda family phage minor tail protein L
MSISSDVQKLEPGKRVRLIEVDGSAFGAGILRFHNETIPHTEAEIIAAGGDESKLEPKSVWWQGQEYGAWPYELTGISVSSDGQSSRPALAVANISGTIGALCRRFQGMAKAKVIIHDTFAHYLDARTFLMVTRPPIPTRSANRFITSTENQVLMMKQWSLSFPVLLIFAGS